MNQRMPVKPLLRQRLLPMKWTVGSTSAQNQIALKSSGSFVKESVKLRRIMTWYLSRAVAKNAKIKAGIAHLRYGFEANSPNLKGFLGILFNI